MRIERIELQGIGPFDCTELTFPPSPAADKAEIHMLVGPNGSGKSTILYALSRLFSRDEPDLLQARLRGSESRVIIQHSGDITALVPADANVGDSLFAGMKSLTHHDESKHPAGCGYYSSENEPRIKSAKPEVRWPVSTALAYRQFSQQARSLSFAAFAYAGTRTLVSLPVQAFKQPDRAPLKDALSFTGTVDPRVLIDWIASTKTKEAIAGSRGDQSGASRHSRVLSRVEHVVSRMAGQSLQFTITEEPLAVHIEHNGVELDLDVLPDGLKSIIAWIADLLMRLDSVPWADNDVDLLHRPFVLFLDEIEIHLHPNWQRKLLPVIQALFPNAQIFLSTHSPFVVGSVTDAWIHPLVLDGHNARADESLPSQAGYSYPAILADVFGVKTEFDDETEALFARFYELKEQRARGEEASELDDVAETLRRRSDETREIVERELRRLNRTLSGARKDSCANFGDRVRFRF